MNCLQSTNITKIPCKQFMQYVVVVVFSNTLPLKAGSGSFQAKMDLLERVLISNMSLEDGGADVHLNKFLIFCPFQEGSTV